MTDRLIIIPESELRKMISDAMAAQMRDIIAMQQRPAEPEYITRAQAAKLLNVTTRTVDNYVYRRRLKRHTTPAGVRFRREEVLLLITKKS